ncbi:hypothetical protein QBZ16_001523 [Prototheca wickerhamii]|uniref:Uncharacterized protein n=1 Tax=Prototheca wickerhamii TaxID=3111 RepID=A0AAD9MGS9_PROWI|nr:hypothetical protein QBZ16_001523 [Prototheca wickerhamii]
MPRLPRLFLMDSHWSERAQECIATLLKDPTAQVIFGTGTAQGSAELSSVRERLAAGVFLSPAEVVKEMDGVWTAVRAGLPPGSTLVSACDGLEASLGQLWRQAGLAWTEDAAAAPVTGHPPYAPPNGAAGPKAPGGDARPRSPLPAPGSPVSAASSFPLPSGRAPPRSPAGRGGHPLQRCLSAIEEAIAASHEAPPAELLRIRDALAPGALQGWGTVAFKSSAEVHEALGACNLVPQLDQLLGSFWTAQGLGPWAERAVLDPPGSLHPDQALPLARQASWGSSSRSLGSDLLTRGGSFGAAPAIGKGKRGGPGGRGSGTRCEVCVRQKRGNCGTALAPKGCLFRPNASGELPAGAGRAVANAPGTPSVPAGGLARRGSLISAKQAAKEREALAALRNLHRKREAAAEAMEQLRHAMQLEQQAAQTNEAIKAAHARLREPPEEAVSEQWWPAGAKGVGVGYDALAARRAARAPRQRALEELGTFWFGSVLVRR